jgi:uncharacterized membrane protein YccC
MMKKIRSLLAGDYARYAILTSVATAAAYFVAALFPLVDSAVAAITALVSVRHTFHDTAKESANQVLGALIGAGIALGAALVFGFTPWVMFFVIVACFALARLMRLDEGGALAIGVTAILVIGPAFSPEFIEKRVLGVAVGVLAAIIASLLVRPGLPQNRALKDAVTHSEEIAHLLDEIAEHINDTRGNVLAETAREWVARADTMVMELAELRLHTEGIVSASKWSPLTSRKFAEDVLWQVRVAQVNARTAYNMARDLLVASRAEGPALGEDVADSVADLISAAAGAISEQADTALESPAERLLMDDTTVVDLADAREEAVENVKNLDDTTAILIAGSLIRDTEKIADALTRQQGKKSK